MTRLISARKKKTCVRQPITLVLQLKDNRETASRYNHFSLYS